MSLKPFVRETRSLVSSSPGFTPLASVPEKMAGWPEDEVEQDSGCRCS